MVLKVYFDGANKADLNLYDRVVLAAVLGTSDQWDLFIADWKMVLDGHKVQYLHTTDAVTLNKTFSKKNGWNNAAVDNLILDCVRAVKKHIAMPSLVPGEYRPGLRVVTMTIYLEDYKRARKSKPELPKSVDEICTSEVLGFVFKWGHEIGAECYHLYFDRGEGFYGHVRDRKDSKKIRRDVPLLDKVAALAEAEMQLTPGLQLADLFAWCISHNEAPSKRLWHRALNDLPKDPSWESLYMDEGYLLNPIPGALERIQTWGTPQRKPKP